MRLHDLLPPIVQCSRLRESGVLSRGALTCLPFADLREAEGGKCILLSSSDEVFDPNSFGLGGGRAACCLDRLVGEVSSPRQGGDAMAYRLLPLRITSCGCDRWTTDRLHREGRNSAWRIRSTSFGDAYSISIESGWIEERVSPFPSPQELDERVGLREG